MDPRAQVFGEVADDYEDVRPGYADELVTAVFDYAGRVPERIVELGAGTGKATAAFAARGVPVTCVEPDPAMAQVLRGRFPGVEVAACRFEEWVPPAGGVPLLICAQAWHWMDEASRLARAHAALAPDGVLALFGHEYRFADPRLEAALHRPYTEHAPELLDEPTDPAPTMHWLAAELAGSPLFRDVREHLFRRIVRYPTQRYVRLLNTFSRHRVLPAEQRERLLTAIAALVDEHGGAIDTRLDTMLALGRRAG